MSSRPFPVPISRLRASPFNVRKTREEDEEFNANIKSLGVLEPPTVRKRDEDYEVIVGQRRFEAAKKAGIEIIQCQVSDLSDTEAVLVSFSENVARCDLTPNERAIVLAQILGQDDLLKAAGVAPAQHLNIEPVSEGKLSEALGLSKSTLRRFLEPLRLQPKTRELLEKGKLSQKTAEEIRKYAKTPDEEEEVAEAFAAKNELNNVNDVTSDKPTLNRDACVAMIKDARKKGLPKQELIEKVKATQDLPDPREEEKEDNKTDEWVPIESVTIDGCVVTDTSIIALCNKHKIRPADYAQDILKAWLETRGYS
jgi:ParB/RepB/Spo0J family partition protein